MSVLLLVRHGQASWGADDYDVLSDLGHEQSRRVGKHLVSLGVTPSRVWSGGLRRHDETVTSAMGAAGWDTEVVTDPGWSEFDHVELVRRFDEATAGDPHRPGDADAFFDAAVARWTAGEHDADYSEPFTVFSRRVDAALRDTLGSLGPGETGVVFTSGGAIAWVAASLWQMGVPQWARINPVLLNTGITKVVTGSRGVNLVSVNEHAHLAGESLTYR
jgi:broad specificity phosphatase PhoE